MRSGTRASSSNDRTNCGPQEKAGQEGSSARERAVGLGSREPSSKAKGVGVEGAARDLGDALVAADGEHARARRMEMPNLTRGPGCTAQNGQQDKLAHARSSSSQLHSTQPDWRNERQRPEE
eukprot:6178379-Pleurochrysis_carterae.AAC.1